MNERELFGQAIEIDDDEQRAAYLVEACGDDAELRAAIEQLVEEHFRTGEFVLDDPLVEQTPTVEFQPALQPGAVIAGRYTLQELIGEGGMGEVWVANQTEPVKRKVALKLIKSGMDSRAVLARFDHERQALAMMDHPHIARVFDGGLTPARQPFFVMELINGLSLTKFCDEARLDVRKRLELFVPICQAVQHAHQKGIVHRDLKPSNILVTIVDGRPIPKVIDFGVAKAVGGNLSDESLSTQFGAIVGTLEYMAPEQAGYSGTDVDTRADVYSLGVILYELLTGLKPHEAKHLRQVALSEMLRIIQEESPSKPSTRLLSNESLPSLAAVRQSDPRRLTALLRGELDWVVMKCLEKQRDRRYETANALSRDIERFLENEVVEARPPSTGYRLAKFVRRHKGQVLAAGLILAALLAGLAGTGYGLLRAEQKRIEAVEQSQIADEERRIATAVQEFLQKNLLQQADVTAQANALLQRGGLAKAKHNPTILELLDRAAAELAEGKIEQNFPNQPRVQAAILQTVGNAYRGIGQYEKSIEFLKRARALHDATLGANHADTLSCMSDLGVTYSEARRLDLAIPLLEQTVAQRKTTLGPEHADTLKSMDSLVDAWQHAYKLDRALPMMKEALELTRKKLGERHPDTLTRMYLLAAIHWRAKNKSLALPLLKKVLKLRREELGKDHPDTLQAVSGIAFIHLRAGEPAQALPFALEAFQRTKATLGESHPGTIDCMSTLADVYHGTDKRRLALPMSKKAVAIAKTQLGPTHPQTLYAMNSLAVLHLRSGDPDSALPLLKQVLADWTTLVGIDHPDRLTVLFTLSQAHLAAGDSKSAIKLLHETLKLRKARLGHEHPDTIQTLASLAEAYGRAGKMKEAIKYLEEELRLLRRRHGADDTATLGSVEKLGVACFLSGQPKRAIPFFQKSLELNQKKHGPDHPKTFSSRETLALAYEKSRTWKPALPLLESLLKHRRKTLGPDASKTIETLTRLAAAFRHDGQTTTAIPHLEEALKHSRKKNGAEHPQTMRIRNSLLSACRKAGKGLRAAELFEEVLVLVRAKHGADNPLVLDSTSKLGVAYWKLRRFKKSIPLFESLLKLQRKKLGPKHEKTLMAAMNLGINYMDNGQIKEALPHLKAAHQASKKHPALRLASSRLYLAYLRTGMREPATALVNERLAEVRANPPENRSALAGELAVISLSFLQIEAWAEAEPVARECLAIREKEQPDSWLTFNTKALVGRALLGQKKFQQAEPLLLAGYRGMADRISTIPPQARSRLREAAQSLMQLYEKTGQKKDAALWKRSYESHIQPKPRKSSN